MREITEELDVHNISGLLKDAGWGAEGGKKRGSLDFLKKSYSEEEIKEMLAVAVEEGASLDEFSDQTVERIRAETGVDPRDLEVGDLEMAAEPSGAGPSDTEPRDGAPQEVAVEETQWFTPDPELAALAEEVESSDDSGLEEALAALMSSGLGGDDSPAIKDAVEEKVDALVPKIPTETVAAVSSERSLPLLFVFGGVFAVGLAAFRKLFSFSWLTDVLASLTLAGAGTAALYKVSESQRDTSE